jgi:FtsP/CotA-like multicopper oxidase with cupredoxin domain
MVHEWRGPHVTPLLLSEGQRIEIDLINHSMMAHPMHLHGHAFQLIAIDGRKINGAVRDTVLVMPMSRVRITFDANNPRRWPFHCHNLYHYWDDDRVPVPGDRHLTICFRHKPTTVSQ